MQGRVAILVLLIDVCSKLDQPLDRMQIQVSRCIVQSSISLRIFCAKYFSVYLVLILPHVFGTIQFGGLDQSFCHLGDLIFGQISLRLRD